MKKLLIVLFLISTTAFGEGITWEECKVQGEELAGVKLISDECESIADDLAVEKNKYIGTNLKVIAHENIIFIKMNIKGIWKSFKISGSNSKLFQIEQIQVNLKEDYIYILNADEENNKMVIGFKAMTSGNMAPQKLVSNKDFKGMNKIILNEKSNSLFGLFETQNKIISIPLDGDSRYTKASLKPSKVTKTASADDKFSNAGDLVLHPEFIMILDKNSSKIIAYDKKDIKFKKPLWDINLLENGVDRIPASIEYKNQELTVTDEDGKKHSFKE